MAECAEKVIGSGNYGDTILNSSQLIITIKYCVPVILAKTDGLTNTNAIIKVSSQE
jgi:hypothetical protein